MPSLGRTARQALIGLVAACALVVLLVVVFAGRSTTTEAHAGQYAHFPGPGSGYIAVSDNSALDPTSAITLEAWVFLTSYAPWGTASAGNCPALVGKAYVTSYWLGLCNGKVRFYPKGGTNMYWDGTGVVPLNSWTHVAATYDGTTTNTYINGVLDSTTASVNGGIGTNTIDLEIGHDSGWDASPKGVLDEVRLWNVARSGSDIAATMHTTITTPQAGLVGAWNMEGDGADAIGGHNGTTNGNIEFSATPLESETPTPSPAPTASPTPAPGAFQKGDVNCDGQLNANDIMPYLKYTAGLGPRPLPACSASPAAAPQGAGPSGQWLNLGAPGSGYVTIPDSPALNPPSAITIEMLVYLTGYTTETGSSFCQSFLGKGFHSSYWLGVCYGHLRFYPHGSSQSRDSVHVIPLRQWTHVAVVADATTLTFYINGVQDVQFTDVTGALVTNTNPVEIASDADYDYRPWGAIDEARIWNVARSQSDIQSTMGAPIVPPQTGLVAAYHFDGNTEDATGAHNAAAAGTLDIGMSLPPVNWTDLDCDGYTNPPGDWLAVLFHAAGLTFALPPGCEPLGTPES